MDIIKDINEAIESGLDGFKKTILQKLAENKDYLEQPYWSPGGLQMTVLNCLIQLHQEKNTSSSTSVMDLRQHIDFVINQTQNNNIGEPLHQAITTGKLQLAIHLLARNKKHPIFDINKRDKNGTTLLSLALATKNKSLLSVVMANKPTLQETTLRGGRGIAYQPLHEAIELDFAYGVNLIATSKNVQLSNPVGLMQDTPVLLAARLGKINALKELLRCPEAQLALDAESNYFAEGALYGDNAIESLCRLLEKNPAKTSLINGIAMLLCRGMEPPRNEKLCQLLSNKRTALLKAVDAYLDKWPALVDPFVERCHISDSPLHSIIYVDHSWGNALRQLLGRPSLAALTVESWVTRKYTKPSKEHPDKPELPIKAAATLTGEESPLKLFAEFVRRYQEAYNSQRFPNRWSTMRWMIAEGKCSWDSVLQYSKSHPTSRTRIIINDMLKTMPKTLIHDDLEASVRHSTPLIS